jgi:cellobiose phosphorylase
MFDLKEDVTMIIQKTNGWKYVGDKGSFKLENPDRNSYLYFPLVNEAGMMSTITPSLHGQVTTGQNTFLMAPLSVEDLHNSKASRNFWVHIKGKGVWSAAGNSPQQNAARFSEGEERTTLEAGFLWHKVTRENTAVGIRAEVTNFVPVTEDKVELMRVTLTNISEDLLTLTPTAVIPLYARSADDLRDHRHVTSLLHRIYTTDHGIEVQPALSFDERGHRINKTSYGVLGANTNGHMPVGFFPITESYIGEGGSLEWPEAIVLNSPPEAGAGESFEGYESVGALRFVDEVLQPGESTTYVVALIIAEERIDTDRYVSEYLSKGHFEDLLEQNEAYWRSKVDILAFGSADPEFDQWMSWVTIQPILRRMYGNSFLPYHDYGRGGRGWRDLWQDCLALMVMEPHEVGPLLFNNYAGVRIDGSNATIIGSKPGEFIADRNNIPRLWMDHGAWPFLTTLLYIHQSGDLEFLLQEQVYFKDSFVRRCKGRDSSWNPEAGSLLQTEAGTAYKGSILEHIILQNIVPFFNVGEHNNCRLEGADWNDGLDMGTSKGESVAFTAFYASNLMEIGQLLLTLKEREIQSTIELAEEIIILFDTLDNPLNYEVPLEKLALLDAYDKRVSTTVSGKKVTMDIELIARDLIQKSQWMIDHLHKNEWISSSEGYEWFNGYYNNDGEQVEGDHPNGVRMTLTGQVFGIMGGIATDEQVAKMTTSVDHYLKDANIGYRLNSNFGGIQQNLGRAFGFAFGHKENGAMFSHMTVMYANALYKRGFVDEGRAVLDSIYSLSSDFDASRMYPGVPEYINGKGRGMYPYLTGSASWLLLTLLSEVYGVKGEFGDLRLEPKLMKDQFGSGNQAAVKTFFADRMLNIVYKNPDQFNYGDYGIETLDIDGESIPVHHVDGGCLIRRDRIMALPDLGIHTIEVVLTSKEQLS